MTQEEIMKGNKLIAEFMGLKPQSKTDNRYFNTPDRMYKYDTDHWKITDTCTPRNMEYHKSWDWLMPVISKCESINSKKIREEIGLRNIFRANINICFEAVITFIEWHNENK